MKHNKACVFAVLCLSQAINAPSAVACSGTPETSYSAILNTSLQFGSVVAPESGYNYAQIDANGVLTMYSKNSDSYIGAVNDTYNNTDVNSGRITISVSDVVPGSTISVQLTSAQLSKMFVEDNGSYTQVLSDNTFTRTVPLGATVDSFSLHFGGELKYNGGLRGSVTFPISVRISCTSP